MGIIMISEDEYEAMKCFCENRLSHTLDDAGKEAENNDLTEEKLQDLLADES